MKTRYAVAMATAAGFALGAFAVQGLHAQAKPPIYYITEIDVANVEGYVKDYAPRAQAIIRAAGGRSVAAGQNVTSIEGAPAPKRVAVTVWDSMEKIQAWRNSADFKQNRMTADKYGAKFRAYTVEGMSQ